MKQLRPFFLGQLILIGLFSFPPVYAMPDCIKDNTVFQLYFLDKNWRDYKLHTYQNPVETLLSEKIIDLTRDSTLCITEKDVELYNWPSQTIFLNRDFIHRLEKIKQILEKAQQLEELKAKSEGGAGVFVLVFKGSRRYGGAVNESYAAGYDVPTLFFRYDSDGRMVITIRPLKTGEAQMTGYSLLDNSLKQIIEKPEIREFFLSLGKLTQNDDPDCVKGWLPKKECDFKFLSKRNKR
jgi:hypothetical protein